MSPARRSLLLRLASTAARVLPAPARQAFYRLGPLSGWLRSALNRAAPAGRSVVAVAGGDLRGARLLLDLHEEKDFWLGTYEPGLQAALRALVRPGMVAYDVGANIGYITLLLARRVGAGGKVLAFEALPDNAARLRQNLALNPELERRVAVHPVAVTDRPGTARFLVHASVGMGKVEGSAGRPEQYAAAIEVPSVALDDFVLEQGGPVPAVIKLDIEGGEVLALPGMGRLLQAHHPLLLMELHGPESARAAWDALRPLGYRIERMAPGFPAVERLEDLDWKAYLVAR